MLSRENKFLTFIQQFTIIKLGYLHHLHKKNSILLTLIFLFLTPL